MPTKLPAFRNDIDPMRWEPLAIKFAIKWGARFPVRDSEQYSDAMFGLALAIRHFDPSRGASFMTYAHEWIETPLRREHQRRTMQKRGGVAELDERTGKMVRRVGVREIAFSQFANPCQEDLEFVPLHQFGPKFFVDRREPDPADDANRLDLREQIEEMLKLLREPYADVLRMHYFENLGAVEIGARIGKRHQHVKEMIRRGLSYLRRAASLERGAWEKFA